MATEYSKGRDFISAAKYVVAEDKPDIVLTFVEFDRINYFHYVLKQLTGYTLHPSIDVSARRCRIADLGTQTA